MTDASATPTGPTVAVFDAFAGRDTSVEELSVALGALGVNAVVTTNPTEAVKADGLVLAASGDAAAALRGLRDAQADRIVGQRLAGSRPVLAVGAAMDTLFETGANGTAGFGEWPGGVDKLAAPMERARVRAAEGSQMLDGATEFTFEAETGARSFELEKDEFIAYPKLSWVEGMRVLAAVENGPLWAVRFHPEKSGAAGTAVLQRWIAQLG